MATKKPERRSKPGPPERAQPNSNEQSGSAGRYTGKEVLDRTKDTGQGRYGQSGAGGKETSETAGQKSYRQSGGNPGSSKDSNRGSGISEDESEQGKNGKPARR